jgi:tetratricopeptide (TPR) repeat protein
VALGVLAHRYYVVRRELATVEAWSALGGLPDDSLLMSASGSEAQAARQEFMRVCRQIVDEGPSTSAEPWALLRLGAMLARDEQFGEAEKTYQRVLEDYADHPAAEAAGPALAAIEEERGDYAEAARRFEQLARERAPLYLFDAGRCWELAEDAGAARQSYERFLEQDAEDDLQEMAQDRLSAIEKGNLLEPPPRPEPEQAEQPPGAGAETPLMEAAPAVAPAVRLE